MSRISRFTPTLVAASLLVLSSSARAQEHGQMHQQGEMMEAASMITASASHLAFMPLAGFPRGTELAVVRGNPAAGGFDAYVRLQPGVRIPVHFHSSSESAVGVSGNLTMEMGGETITLKPGDYTFIPWKMHHAASCPESSSEQCVGFFTFDMAFDVTWVEAPPADPNPMPGGGN